MLIMRATSGQGSYRYPLSCRQQVIHQQLQAPLALIVVDIEAVDELQGALGESESRFFLDVIEGDRIEGAAGARQLEPHFEVPVADHARAADGEDAVETRLGEGLSP